MMYCNRSPFVSVLCLTRGGDLLQENLDDILSDLKRVLLHDIDMQARLLIPPSPALVFPTSSTLR